ncbi:MAG TPA: hypothetical protein VFZ56_04995 [Gemmatimonadaceae bacterium]
METPGRIAELERKFAENPRRYFAALANEFRKQGDLDRAIELCESHLAEQRNHLSGHVVLAQALVDAGRESDAWDPLHTALDLDPENFIALRLIGELSAKTGDVEHARTFFFRALEIEPRNEQLLTAVKNLSQRQAIPAAEPAPAGEPVEPAADAAVSVAPREPKEESWAEVAPLSGLESSTAFEAVEAAEPVAEEPPAAGGVESVERPEPSAIPPRAETPATELDRVEDQVDVAEPVGEPWVSDLSARWVAEESPEAEAGAREVPEPDKEPPVQEPEAGEPVLDAPALVTPAHGDPFSDWLPSGEGVVEPAEEEDWMTAAGSVASQGDGDTGAVREEQRSKPYDYHDWLPPLSGDTSAVTDTAAAPVAPETSDAADVTGTPVPLGAAADAVGQQVEAAEPPAAVSPAELHPAAEADIAAIEPPQRAEEVEPRPVLASETMADLYLQQGHVSLAVEVLRELVASRPDDERLRARLAEVGRAAAAPPRETVRDMFARFARTAQPLRERTPPRTTDVADAREPEPAGPLGEFFGDGASGYSDPRANALLAMATPAAAASEGEDFERWLAGARRP